MFEYLAHLKNMLIAATYQPLVKDLPGFDAGGDLGSYINSLYKIALALGSTAGVLLIAYAGIEYMTTDVVTKKKDGIKRIRMAVTGLLMLLGTYLVFNQIDPNILNLTIGGK